MYVYVTDKGNIMLRSKERVKSLWVKWVTEHIVNYDMTDNLIYEWGQVVKYENSKQYVEDTNRYHLEKELKHVKLKNEELTKISNKRVTKELELEQRWLEANEYQRKIYLLKQMRWSQQ